MVYEWHLNKTVEALNKVREKKNKTFVTLVMSLGCQMTLVAARRNYLNRNFEEFQHL